MVIPSIGRVHSQKVWYKICVWNWNSYHHIHPSRTFKTITHLYPPLLFGWFSALDWQGHWQAALGPATFPLFGRGRGGGLRAQPKSPLQQADAQTSTSRRHGHLHMQLLPESPSPRLRLRQRWDSSRHAFQRCCWNPGLMCWRWSMWKAYSQSRTGTSLLQVHSVSRQLPVRVKTWNIMFWKANVLQFCLVSMRNMGGKKNKGKRMREI